MTNKLISQELEAFAIFHPSEELIYFAALTQAFSPAVKKVSKRSDAHRIKKSVLSHLCVRYCSWYINF